MCYLLLYQYVHTCTVLSYRIFIHMSCKSANRIPHLFTLFFHSVQEIALSVVENESAQTSLQISEVASQLKRLQQGLNDQNEAIQKQNSLITMSEAEIVRNSALIERKQTQTDQLNKKILLKISKMEGVSILVISYYSYAIITTFFTLLWCKQIVSIKYTSKSLSNVLLNLIILNYEIQVIIACHNFFFLLSNWQ